MILKNLFFILAFISITHQIQASSYNPSWSKKNLSTATNPIQATLPKNPAEQTDSKEPKLEIVKLPLPPVKVYGFIAGDRDLYTPSGQDAFNRFIQEKILRSSENHEEFFDTEIATLENHAKDKVNKFVYGKVEPLKKDAKNKEILWNPGHIFTPSIEKHPAGYPTLTGFHHDHLQAVEKSEVFEFRDKQEYDHGFYCANIAIDSNNPKSQFRKTFFPASWTRKQVVDCILLSMKKIESNPAMYNNGVATEYMFSTPAQTKSKALNTSLNIGFRVFNNNKITSMPTVYPELPSR